MNTIQRSLVFISASIFTLFFTINTHAATVIPSNYMVGGNAGDTWTYANLDGTQFTSTLSVVTSGVNAGRFKLEKNGVSTVYDVTGNDLNFYEYNNTPVNPPFVLSEIELGLVVTADDGTPNPSMYLFWDVPSITVQAGTFTDVVAIAWLDANYSANVANTLLGLDPLITIGVTGIDYYAWGIGQVQYQGIAALTGLSDGFGYELVSTTVVPIPAALPLFLSGLFGILFINKNKAKKTA